MTEHLNAIFALFITFNLIRTWCEVSNDNFRAVIKADVQRIVKHCMLNRATNLVLEDYEFIEDILETSYLFLSDGRGVHSIEQKQDLIDCINRSDDLWHSIPEINRTKYNSNLKFYIVTDKIYLRVDDTVNNFDPCNLSHYTTKYSISYKPEEPSKQIKDSADLEFNTNNTTNNSEDNNEVFDNSDDDIAVVPIESNNDTNDESRTFVEAALSNSLFDSNNPTFDASSYQGGMLPPSPKTSPPSSSSLHGYAELLRDPRLWTEDEITILVAKQAAIGNKWTKIAKSLPKRSKEAVHKKWNYLLEKNLVAPSIHAAIKVVLWTPEEDKIISDNRSFNPPMSYKDISKEISVKLGRKRSYRCCYTRHYNLKKKRGGETRHYNLKKKKK